MNMLVNNLQEEGSASKKGLLYFIIKDNIVFLAVAKEKKYKKKKIL
jgi:hypothetical protein